MLAKQHSRRGTSQLLDPESGQSSALSSNADEDHHLESHLLSEDEVRILAGTLDLKDKIVLNHMVPAQQVFSLSTLDKVLLRPVVTYIRLIDL